MKLAVATALFLFSTIPSSGFNPGVYNEQSAEFSEVEKLLSSGLRASGGQRTIFCTGVNKFTDAPTNKKLGKKELETCVRDQQNKTTLVIDFTDNCPPRKRYTFTRARAYDERYISKMKKIRVQNDRFFKSLGYPRIVTMTSSAFGRPSVMVLSDTKEPE
jgi:hypothetical protein